MGHIIFPVRPRPFKDESFRGYVLRIARRNGRKTLDEICKLIRSVSGLCNYSVGHQSYRDFIERLSPALKISAAQLSDHFKECEKHFYDESRFLKDIKVHNPKLCTTCVEINGYFKDEWQQLTVTHCSTHNLLLIDACSNCGSALEWNSDLFEKCSHCNNSLKEMLIVESDAPVYQQSAHDSGALRALTEAFVFTLRPYDLIFDRIQKLEIKNSDAHIHFLQAHALITDATFRRKWFEDTCFKNIPLAQPFLKHINIEEYLANFSRLYHYDKEPKLPRDISTKHEIDSICRKPRRNIAKSDMDLRSHLRIVEASRFLKIETEDLYVLMKKGLIDTINKMRYEKDYLFDVRAVNSVNTFLIQKCMQSDPATSHKLVPLTQLLDKLRYFNISLGFLLTLLRTENHNIFAAEDATHWTDIHVDPFNFITWLNSIYINYLSSDINFKSISALTGLNEEHFLAFINATSNIPVLHETKGTIRPEAAISFLNKYITLNRLSKIYDLDTKSLLNMLLAHNLNPSHQLGDSRVIYIYDNADITLKAINNCIAKLLDK